MEHTKRVFLIHGWDGKVGDHWFPWLTHQLVEKEFTVFAPELPDSGSPKIDAWVGELSRVVGVPDKDTYFVGHSMGCQAILRYLEKLPSKVKVGGAVFVGGFLTLTGLDTEEDKAIAEPWLFETIDFEKIKKHTGNFVAIFSDDDKFVPLENKAFFEERLGAKTVVEHEQGHFCRNDGVTELPSALEALCEMSEKS